MGVSTKLVQPLTFVELFRYTKHYTSSIIHDEVIIYELHPEARKNLNFNMIQSSFREWIFCFNADANDNSYAIYEIGPLIELTPLVLPGFDFYIGIRFSSKTFYTNTPQIKPFPMQNKISLYMPHTTALMSHKELICQLKHAELFETRIHILNQYIRDQKHLYPFPSTILYILNKIDENNGKLHISDLAHDLSYSERHINYIFMEYFPFGPKDYCRYARFQNALHEMLANPFRQNSEFLVNTGYSDQSHFQRDFKSFTGITPKQYINRIIAETQT